MSDGRLRVAAALLLTSPFVPMIFQGEEWGASSEFPYFTDHADPDLADAVRQGRLAEFAEFGWRAEDVPDPQDISTFERAKLDWAQPAKDGHADLLSWYRRLIDLRREYPGLTNPRLDRTSVDYDEHAGWLTIHRGAFLTAINLGPAPWICPVGMAAQLLASSDPLVQLTDAGVQLPPDTAAIVLGPASQRAA
jgi:maltooligosyltrehalose trehalohydrolase